MKNKVLLVAFMAVGIAFTGCKKEKGVFDIEINSPEKNMSYSSPVPLNVHIHGEEIIHDIEIKVYQKSDPTVIVFDYDNHVEVKDFEVNETILANVTVPTIFTVWVKVGEDDHVKEYSHDFTIQ